MGSLIYSRNSLHVKMFALIIESHGLKRRFFKGRGDEKGGIYFTGERMGIKNGIF